jgi:hypothetical protein
MEIRSPLENGFTLARYRPHENSLAKILDLHQGFRGVLTETQIDDPLLFPPYGILELSPLSGASHGEISIKTSIRSKGFFLKGGKQWNTRPLN